MNDVIDLRTRLVYASLSDHELVRQLEEARTGVFSHAHPDTRDRWVPPPRHGTRPWLPAASTDDAAHAVGVSHQPSEWATDDPSYYLG